mmetsp:Transcript_26502/g.45647  ORF Transcript_26502/g.45647 Transcript_26502/m.45647 type:complete len:208 (+) Transcript_26502:359-982(+)
MNSMVPDLLLRCHTAVLDTGALLPELENVSTAAKKATGLGNAPTETEGTGAIPAENPDTSLGNAGKGPNPVAAVGQKAEANLLGKDAKAEANHAAPPADGPPRSLAASRRKRPRPRTKATARLSPTTKKPAARIITASVAAALRPSKKAGIAPRRNANAVTMTTSNWILHLFFTSSSFPSCLVFQEAGFAVSPLPLRFVLLDLSSCI